MKKFTTIEAEMPSRRWIAPAIGAAVSLTVLLWAANHIVGNCLDLKDVFTYCEMHK